MKMPWMKFYVNDWLSDERLRSVSVTARGMWIDMLCFMWKSSKRGYLEIHGKPMTQQSLSQMCGMTLEDGSKCLKELLDAGVYSLKNDVIFSRRMAEEDQISGKRATAARHRWKTVLHMQNACKTDANVMQTTMQNACKPLTYDISSLRSKEETTAESHRVMRGILEEQIAMLWKAYPCKKSKQPGIKAIREALKRASFETIMAGVQLYADEQRGQDPRKLKYAQGWFNDSRWTDEAFPMFVEKPKSNRCEISTAEEIERLAAEQEQKERDANVPI